MTSNPFVLILSEEIHIATKGPFAWALASVMCIYKLFSSEKQRQTLLLLRGMLLYLLLRRPLFVLSRKCVISTL